MFIRWNVFTGGLGLQGAAKGTNNTSLFFNKEFVEDIVTMTNC
jgi:hypothetical protein